MTASGSTTTSSCSCRAPAKAPAARAHRLLPPHARSPSSEIFRTLPWREQMLEGMLGRGPHRLSHVRLLAALRQRVLRILGVESEVDRLSHEGRVIRLGCLSDGHRRRRASRSWRRSRTCRRGARDPRVDAAARRSCSASTGSTTRRACAARLLAVERLLGARTVLCAARSGSCRSPCPSREKTDDYRVVSPRDRRAGRAASTARTRTVHGSPIQYLYRSVSQRQLVAMYRAADVMVVTPLRDGMNLVCKEFVASRTDGDGVLVLSEIAGAASELGEALHRQPLRRRRDGRHVRARALHAGARAARAHGGDAAARDGAQCSRLGLHVPGRARGRAAPADTHRSPRATGGDHRHGGRARARRRARAPHRLRRHARAAGQTSGSRRPRRGLARADSRAFGFAQDLRAHRERAYARIARRRGWAPCRSPSTPSTGSCSKRSPAPRGGFSPRYRATTRSASGPCSRNSRRARRAPWSRRRRWA